MQQTVAKEEQDGTNQTPRKYTASPKTKEYSPGGEWRRGKTRNFKLTRSRPGALSGERMLPRNGAPRKGRGALVINDFAISAYPSIGLWAINQMMFIGTITAGIYLLLVLRKMSRQIEVRS